MEKTLKRRLAAGVGALAVGVAIAFVGGPAVSRQSARTESVVQMKTNVKAGTKITANMVELTSAYVKDQPGGALKSLSSVVGHYAKSDLYAKDTVTSGKISESVDTVPDGQEEISVSVKNSADDVSDTLQAGDIVSVYGVSTTNAVGASYRLDALKYVKVLNYSSTGNTGSSSTSTSSTATLTLLVYPKQAQYLSAWDNATLHFSLVSRGNIQKANSLLSEEKELLESIPDSDVVMANGNQTTSSASSASSEE